MIDDGIYEVGVHIADVTHFVPHGSALDLEARKRATSVYFVTGCTPMLPQRLCNSLCSLVPGVDRLAYSVVWRMNIEGQVIGEPWFGKSVICSCMQIDYNGAQAIIEGKIPEEVPCPHDPHSFLNRLHPSSKFTLDEIIADIGVLHKMAAALKRDRYESGSVNLNLFKMSFQLNENGDPVSVAPYILRESNSLIEEFMLLANKSVAKRIFEHFPEGGLIRCHPPPNGRLLSKMIKIFERQGNITVDVSSSGSLHRSLSVFRDMENKNISAVTLSSFLSFPSLLIIFLFL